MVEDFSLLDRELPDRSNVYVVGGFDIGVKEIFVQGELNIEGCCDGDEYLSILIGTLKFTGNGRVSMKNLTMTTNDNNLCVDINANVRVRPVNITLLRENSFNHALVRGHNPNEPRFNEKVAPPSFIRYLKVAITGGATSSLIYSTWLGYFMYLAGGAVNYGPATAVFGPMAFYWSGTFSCAVFGGVGALAAVGGYLAFKYIDGSVRTPPPHT
jgi:hypothetical protein